MNLVEVLKESRIFKHTCFFLLFSTFNAILYLLTLVISDEKSVVVWISDRLYVTLSCFSVAAFRIFFFVFGSQQFDYDVFGHIFFLIYPLWDFLILNLCIDIFTEFEKFWPLFLQICFFAPVFFSGVTQISLILSQRSLNKCFILFNPFIFFIFPLSLLRTLKSYLFIHSFTDLFLAVLGLCCCTQAFLKFQTNQGYCGAQAVWLAGFRRWGVWAEWLWGTT